MKEYTALHYIKDDAGVMYTPGEIFDADLDDAAERRLLRLGAVIVNGETAAEKEVFDNVTDDDAEDEYPEAETVAVEAPVIDVMEGVSAPKKRGRKA